jgi:hypothetical protein
MLGEWEAWLGVAADRLLALDDRVQTNASPTDAADVAKAFVVRKAIADRLADIRLQSTSNLKAAVALGSQPVADSSGRVVGNDLAHAATELDALLSTVEGRLDAIERASIAEVELSADINRMLDEAELLSERLKMNANSVAALRHRWRERTNLTEVAASAESELRSLQAADRERSNLLGRADSIHERLQAAMRAESAANELAELCRSKVLQAPPLAVPSVEHFGEVPTLDDLHAMPFMQLRGTVAPLLMKLDRLDAALREATQRFRAPLAERDELRGLLQAYRDKAAQAGKGEDPLIEPMYRAAADVLWAAPTDLSKARPLVDAYVRAVTGASR